MRVIVTRPRRQGTRTAIRLAELGHEAVLLPLTHPAHDADAGRDALARTQGAIAVTSTEAILALQALKPFAASDLNRAIFTVGPTTAAAASEAGFQSIFHSDGDGRRLAGLVSDRRPLLAGKPLLYLAGCPRAEGFETRLLELGVPFETVECYSMQDLEPDVRDMGKLFADEPSSAVLLYSRHTAARFFDLLLVKSRQDRMKDVQFLCLSDAVATAVPTTLRQNVRIASAPDEESLLALLDAA